MSERNLVDMKVMVLGRDSMARRLVTSLSGCGMDVVSATDPAGAVPLLAGDQFDLVVVDDHMLEAFAACRDGSESWNTPVVLSMANTGTNWGLAMSLGVDGHIHDGMGHAEVCARLNSVVRRRGSGSCDL